MSLFTQIKVIILIVLFLLPIIPVYLFFPQEKLWSNSKIDIEGTLGVGFIFAAIFNLMIILIILLMTVFPLLAIIIIAVIGLVIKNDFDKIYKQAIYNYNKFHTNKD